MRTQSCHFGNIVNSLGDGLGVDVCSLYSLNPAGDQLILVATKGLNQSAVGARMSTKQGLTGVVARTRRSLSVKNPDTHPDYFHIKGSNEEKFRSYLGIPLIKENILFGVLVVQTVRAKMFFMSEIEMLYAAGYRVIDCMTEKALAA